MKQRHVSAAIGSDDHFSYLPAQVMANQENFDRTIMEIDTAQADYYVIYKPRIPTRGRRTEAEVVGT